MARLGIGVVSLSHGQHPARSDRNLNHAYRPTFQGGE